MRFRYLKYMLARMCNLAQKQQKSFKDFCEDNPIGGFLVWSLMLLVSDFFLSLFVYPVLTGERYFVLPTIWLPLLGLYWALVCFHTGAEILIVLKKWLLEDYEKYAKKHEIKKRIDTDYQYDKYFKIERDAEDICHEREKDSIREKLS